MLIVIAAVLPAEAQLIGHYPLDEIVGGTTTPDATGINSAGVLNGSPTLAVGAGQIGNALTFTGAATQFVGIPDLGFGQTAFTASVWFDPAANSQGPLANWTNAGASPRTFLIRTDAGGVLQTFVRSGATQVGGSAAGLPSVTTGSMHHAVITYDGQTMRTYLDGQLATNTFAFAAPVVLGEGVQGTAAIGGRGGSENSMTGLIDDVAFWSETLDLGKVRALFNLAGAAELNYDAGEADLLFQVYDGDLPSVAIDNLVWTPAAGLGGSTGDVVNLGGGSFFLNLDGNAGVVGVVPQAVPEPASLAVWLLMVVMGVGYFAYRRKRQP
jgi:hypothetical protein